MTTPTAYLSELRNALAEMDPPPFTSSDQQTIWIDDDPMHPDWYYGLTKVRPRDSERTWEEYDSHCILAGRTCYVCMRKNPKPGEAVASYSWPEKLLLAWPKGVDTLDQRKAYIETLDRLDP